MLELANIRKAFNQGQHNEYWALKGIDLEIPPARVNVLKGPSGSGKTTLLTILGCLARPTEGRVRINGQPCAKPGRAIGPGDVLTFGLGGEVMVVRILACGTRRGPATEAATLWEPLGETKRPAAAPPPEQAF